MQLTIADVITTRTYHFEANEKDNSPNTEHLGFDTSQMASTPKMHYDSRECDVTWQRPIEWSATTQGLRKTGLKNQFADFCSMCDLYHTLAVNLIYLWIPNHWFEINTIPIKHLKPDSAIKLLSSSHLISWSIFFYIRENFKIFNFSFVREINT